MTSNALPIDLYQGLLVKLVAVLEVLQALGAVDGSSSGWRAKSSVVLSPLNKQALFKATSTFKGALNQARELAIALPGGEMLTEEQDDVIEMLERLRDRKSDQLSHFSDRVLSSVSVATDHLRKMEVDSTASTPLAPI